MTWIKAIYEPAALFSYRVPGHSSQYATASPLPGPSTIKLGLVSTAIETSGSIDEGRRIFDIIKASKVRIAPSHTIAISNVILRRLKASRAGGGGFQQTVIQRGYVHFSDPLTIYLEVGQQPNLLMTYLKKLRYLGTGDSMLYCISEPELEDPLGYTVEPEDIGAISAGVLIVPVMDINPDPEITFDNLTPFSAEGAKKALIPKVYFLRIASQKRGKNWVVYYVG